MSTFTFDTSELNTLFARLRDASGKTKPAMEAIANDIKSNIELCFTDSKSPYGVGWAALSAVTLSRRRKEGKGAKILRDTGILSNSFSSTATEDTAIIGTNVPYAPTHQFGARKGQYGNTKHGAPIPWGNIPARPFFPIQGSKVVLPDTWFNEAKDTLERHLIRAMTA